VHIEHRVPTSPWVESGGVGVAIGEEHRESTRKHGQGEQEQNVGDEHAPHKQGNSKHFLTRAAHLQDCGENVERAGTIKTKRIKNATNRAKSAIASERAKAVLRNGWIARHRVN
jgi:hypothetical protein